MKRLLFVLLLVLSFSGNVFAKEEKIVVLATTTSVRDSGLMDYLLPMFKEDTGYSVDMIAVGTGKALQMGEDGEADVLLVHAKESELKFMKEGHGTKRKELFHNYFVIVGPKNNIETPSVKEAFNEIKNKNLDFVSRGDGSGTNKKELQLWEENNIIPSGNWYISAGSGMAATLKLADELKAYTLSDIATYLNLKDTLDLEIKVGEDSNLRNQYSVITIDPSKNKYINEEGADTFMNWLASDKIEEKIGEFGKDKFGVSLFTPDQK